MTYFSSYELHFLEIKYMEGLPACHADIAIFVEKFHCVKGSSFGTYRFFQIEDLIVKEPVTCYELHWRLVAILVKPLFFRVQGFHFDRRTLKP